MFTFPLVGSLVNGDPPGTRGLKKYMWFLDESVHFYRRDLIGSVHLETNFTTWLNSSRRDSAIARSVNLQVTDMLINKLREQARDLSAWETTIMCGGMWAETHCKPSERPHICPHCEERMIPSIHHILWECSMWSHLRLLPCPTNDLTSRLGWNQHGACLPILRQCGSIRSEHVKLRRTKRCAGGRRGPGAPSLSEDIWAGNLALLSRVTMQRRLRSFVRS